MILSLLVLAAACALLWWLTRAKPAPKSPEEPEAPKEQKRGWIGDLQAFWHKRMRELTGNRSKRLKPRKSTFMHRRPSRARASGRRDYSNWRRGKLQMAKTSRRINRGR